MMRRTRRKKETRHSEKKTEYRVSMKLFICFQPKEASLTQAFPLTDPFVSQRQRESLFIIPLSALISLYGRDHIVNTLLHKTEHTVIVKLLVPLIPEALYLSLDSLILGKEFFKL